MEPLMRVLALSIGGVLGVNARYWLGVWISRWASPQFPWATLIINVSGSFAIGVLTVVLLRWLPHPNARLIVLTGVLGGYTTFSTFAFETAALWERGDAARSLGYVVGSVVGGLVAVTLGIALGRALTAPAAEIAATPDRASAVAPEATRSVDADGGLVILQDVHGVRDEDHPDRVGGGDAG